jgi:hypothetical protein
MGVSYDVFTEMFLDKVEEYDFPLTEDERNSQVDGYMRRAISAFRFVCKYDLSATGDDEAREFAVEIPGGDLVEIADIVSDGMLLQWMKPYVNKGENLENVLNTRDYTSYSPAELILRITGSYKQLQKDFIQSIREYSFNHNDLTVLHI